MNLLDTLDDLTLDLPTASTSSSSFLDSELVAPTLGELVYLASGEIDPRLKLLSHSSRQNLHKCPRKYQLYRLQSKELSLEAEKEAEQGVTFAFGTAVGVGVQSALEGKTEDQIIIDTFLAWDTDLLSKTVRHKKSFWEVVYAVQRFLAICEDGYLDEYELVSYQGKPAVELSFRITLPDGYFYRGYVDAVLRHKKTGAIIVLECKTSASEPNSAQYKNSGQAIGYSIVLDILFPEMSSYTVLYLVYSTGSRSYTQMPFEKSLLQRALWLQELLIDTRHIAIYEEFGTYPMHGENCYDFFRECEYLGLCTLTTENLVKPLTEEVLAKIDKEEYMFEVDFIDLVQSQLDKGTA